MSAMAIKVGRDILESCQCHYSPLELSSLRPRKYLMHPVSSFQLGHKGSRRIMTEKLCGWLPVFLSALLYQVFKWYVTFFPRTACGLAFGL
ncbi:Hypothetical predicted protein [Podarcis lilfordi]|uniref:Uncharacterized protein n=1 Tax=Podarcis lilfordi TaxID=74358 RepID=A0AA35KM96_9SAUR|nr:Hypothetical predicted protein [Podarcis lilfordi]